MGTSGSKHDEKINTKYLYYIKHEKEKFMENANIGNRHNSNMCSEIFSYCHAESTELYKSAWREHLQKELLRLRGNNEWAGKILSIMKKFGPFSDLKYINEVNWTNFKFGIFEKNHRIFPNSKLVPTNNPTKYTTKPAVDYVEKDGMREDSAPTFLQKEECSLNIANHCSAHELMDKNIEEITLRDLQPEKVSDLIQKLPIIEADVKSSWTQGCKPSSNIKVPNYTSSEQQEADPQEKIQLIKSLLEGLSSGNNASVFSELDKKDCNRSDYLSCLQKSLLDYRNNDAISLLVREEKNKREMRHFLTHYKKIVVLIFRHLRDDKNIFMHFFKSFKDYFINKYGEGKDSTDKKTEKDLCHGVCDIQEFTKLMQETLCIFYKFGSYKEILKEKCLFTKENITNVVINFIVDKEIYQTIMNVQRSLDRCFEQKLVEKFKKFELEEPWPEDFGVRNEFSLTMSTIAILRERQDKCDFIYLDGPKGEMNCTPERIKSQERFNEFFNSLKTETQKGSQNLERRLQQDFPAGNSKNTREAIPDKKSSSRMWATNECPFQSAIDELKKIDRYCCPVMKMKTALACSEEIINCIRRFYSNQGILFNVGDVSAEDVLSILLFVVSRAKIQTLHSQCTFISKFINNRTSNSIAGYYLTTLQACLLYLTEE